MKSFLTIEEAVQESKQDSKVENSEHPSLTRHTSDPTFTQSSNSWKRSLAGINTIFLQRTQSFADMEPPSKTKMSSNLGSAALGTLYRTLSAPTDYSKYEALTSGAKLNKSSSISLSPQSSSSKSSLFPSFSKPGNIIRRKTVK